MSAPKFKFVLKLTRTGRSGIEMSGRIGEEARDAILAVIAEDCQRKKTRSEKIKSLSEKKEMEFVKYLEATSALYAARRELEEALAGDEADE
jgi:hypothetical protein